MRVISDSPQLVDASVGPRSRRGALSRLIPLRCTHAKAAATAVATTMTIAHSALVTHVSYRVTAVGESLPRRMMRVSSVTVARLIMILVARATHGSRFQTSDGRRSDAGHHMLHHSGGHRAIARSSLNLIPRAAPLRKCRASPTGASSATSNRITRSLAVRSVANANTRQAVVHRKEYAPKLGRSRATSGSFSVVTMLSSASRSARALGHRSFLSRAMHFSTSDERSAGTEGTTVLSGGASSRRRR